MVQRERQLLFFVKVLTAVLLDSGKHRVEDLVKVQQADQFACHFAQKGVLVVAEVFVKVAMNCANIYLIINLGSVFLSDDVVQRKAEIPHLLHVLQTAGLGLDRQ